MATGFKFESKIKILSQFTYDAVSDLRELLWRCGQCGLLAHRKCGVPDYCPSCAAPHREFTLIEED